MDGSEAPTQAQNLLVIREDYFVHYKSPVFPPAHAHSESSHESEPSNEPSNEPSEASDEPSDGEPSDDEPSDDEASSPATSDLQSRAVGEAIMRRWEIVKAKVISGIVGFGFHARRLCSALPVTAMAAALFLLLLLFLFKIKIKMRLPWRPPTAGVCPDNQHRLLLLLKHKDQKISELLVQIAQMNEMLSARRKVPVVRVK
ncbi:uncharacterized protein LOC111450604 isoform X1 [Cucurbita moschata]|uniref:Uncharacterized protein LOC111450604 isoform X1 n=1 Tax=Cucurbita moschata TaxID=3662 RepID=A0A6J1G485_CUCMO|nr:uncharacterized protein LOC111450604 isoform X1 [Cucurbita moschata]